MAKPGAKSKVALSEVSVRPVRDGAERARWDRLMDEHHYLGFRCLHGGVLRHVAETPEGRWVALLGWSPGAFKVGATPGSACARRSPDMLRGMGAACGGVEVDDRHRVREPFLEQPPHFAHAGAFPSARSARYAASSADRAADTAIRRMRWSTSAGCESGPSPDADATSADACLAMASASSFFVVSNSRLGSLRSSATVLVAIAGVLRSSDFEYPRIERPRRLRRNRRKTTIGWKRSLTNNLSCIRRTTLVARPDAARWSAGVRLESNLV